MRREEKYQSIPRKLFYQVWQSGNKILCNGKCMLGYWILNLICLSSENEKLIGTFFIIFIPLILYYIFLGPYYAEHYPGVLVVAILLHINAQSLMIIAVLTDPGIIPKIVLSYKAFFMLDWQIWAKRRNFYDPFKPLG
jgi:palmitoyltransferase ZDHHC9/14/18